MYEITYQEMVTFITLIWISVRIIAAVKNKRVSAGREALLLLVYICIVVIVRFVYFPLHRVNGQIETLKFDISRIIPPWVNLVPIVHLFDTYDGWQINIIGNIAMFIPVGIVWPICFKKLDSVWKTVRAGAVMIGFIEVSQLLFYDRCSDVDDFILNTIGVMTGALIYFGIKKRDHF